MIQFIVWLLVWSHVLLGVASLESETCDPVLPVDTNANIGGKAVIKCRLSSQNIAWTFCPKNSGPRLIASNCEVSDGDAASYSIDKTGNACNLVIENVTDSQLGSYTCQDMSLKNKGHTVELGNSGVNLALRKNATQSVTYTHPNPYIVAKATLAVDGNSDGYFEAGSCSFANSGPPTWWAVDLEKETHIGRVRIKGRTAAVSRMVENDNFIIGLTNESPWTTPPSKLNQTNICKYFHGYLPPVPVDIYCEPNTVSGRYLYVLKYDTANLCICELEAYYN